MNTLLIRFSQSMINPMGFEARGEEPVLYDRKLLSRFRLKAYAKQVETQECLATRSNCLELVAGIRNYAARKGLTLEPEEVRSSRWRRIFILVRDGVRALSVSVRHRKYVRDFYSEHKPSS